jgi:hypothetical protein
MSQQGPAGQPFNRDALSLPVEQKRVVYWGLASITRSSTPWGGPLGDLAAWGWFLALCDANSADEWRSLALLPRNPIRHSRSADDARSARPAIDPPVNEFTR